MRNFKLIPLLALFLVSAYAAQAQKVKVVSGDVKALAGQKEINLEFDYSNMAVGDFKKESDYMKKKMEEYDKSEPGRGEKWKAAWIADRDGRFAPKFEALFNDHCPNLSGGRNKAGAKYTMVIHTIFTEPGWNIGVMRRSASINVQIVIKEGSKEVCKMDIYGIPGRDFGGFDFETGARLEEAYAKCGKTIGGYLAKQLK